MKTTFSLTRDIIIILALMGSFVVVQLNPVEKRAASDKINLSELIPEEIPERQPRWKSLTFDTSDYKDKWQSINELLVRKYYQRDHDNVDFILEYSSDMRKNFSFHFPENCHRSGGNEVDFLEPLEIRLSENRTLKAKFLFIEGVRGTMESRDKLVAYWVVIDNEQFHRTFWVKVDQMLSGLLKQAKAGFLVRIDFVDGVEYTEEGLKKGRTLIREFVRDLYKELGPEERDLIFGKQPF